MGAMSGKELHPSNYRRIWLINCLLAPPLLGLFSWPYLYLSWTLGLDAWAAWAGAFIFAFTFTLTLLHGHVTRALGTLHRDHYYEWLKKSRWKHGLLFHSALPTTRFRLALFYISIAILMLGDLLAN